MVDNNFWFGKNVLVTGGGGFVASNLVIKLLSFGANVTITVRNNKPVYTIDTINKDGFDFGSRPKVENCNLFNFDNLKKICDNYKIDTIFHLAASTIVSDAAASPVATTENNVMATLNILEVARINKISRVLVASSDKAYGDHADDTLEVLPYREDYALRGLDVYSASKVCADMLAQTYSYQFKVPIVVVRACNIYGPGDFNFTRLIPRTIMCLLSNKSPQINQGNENVLREYIYIDDVIESYMFLMENVGEYYGLDNCNMPRKGRETYGWAAFNIGSYSKIELLNKSNCDKIKSVSQIIDLLKIKIIDIPSVIKAKPPNFIEIPDQYMDSGKLIKLGFKPKSNFVEGLDKTIEWYRKNYEFLEKMAVRYINI